MNKLATIGALAVALAIPASAAGKSIPRLHNVRQANCVQTVVIMPTRGYGVCGGRFWIRDESGQVTQTPLWRLKLRPDRPDDHP